MFQKFPLIRSRSDFPHFLSIERIYQLIPQPGAFTRARLRVEEPCEMLQTWKSVPTRPLPERLLPDRGVCSAPLLISSAVSSVEPLVPETEWL